MKKQSSGAEPCPPTREELARELACADNRLYLEESGEIHQGGSAPEEENREPRRPVPVQPCRD